MSELISIASKERIGGTAFTLIYNALPGSAHISTSRRARSRAIREAAADSGYRNLSIWQYEDNLFWLLGPAHGISFARQIDNFIDDSTEIDQQVPGVVVAQLDSNLYLAEINRGSVVRERVLAPDTATEYLNDCNDKAMPVYVCDTGVELINLAPFNPTTLSYALLFKSRRNPYQFRPLWREMLRMRLFHPGQLTRLALPLFIMICAIGFGIQYPQYLAEQAQRLAAEKNRQLAQLRANEQRRQQRGQAGHGGASNLALVADWPQRIQALGGDGLERVVINPGEIIITGTTGRFAHRAAQWVQQDGWAWSSTATGWSLSRPMDFIVDQRKVTADPWQMRAHLRDTLQQTQRALQIVQISTAEGFEQVDFSLTLDPVNSLVLTQLAGLLHDKPYELLGLDCAYDGWQLNACIASFTARYRVAPDNS